jgi:hypothetical protein
MSIQVNKLFWEKGIKEKSDIRDIVYWKKKNNMY